LTDVATRWAAMDHERDVNAVLDDYRISVGLLVQTRR